MLQLLHSFIRHFIRYYIIYHVCFALYSYIKQHITISNNFIYYWAFLIFSVDRRLSVIFGNNSVNITVPRKTKIVPIQWYSVKGFLKYIIEKIRDKNFRNVMTKVTVSDVHSAVNVKTELMHTYLRLLLRIINY